MGSLGRTFKKEHLSLKIGELFDNISREIFEDRTPFAYKAQFSLVNVTNLHTNTSIGYSVVPPKQTFGKNAGLIFTFALTGNPYTKDISEPLSFTQNYDGMELITYWSMRLNGIEYLSISFNKITLKRLGLLVNTEPELVYVYNTIGILTKSFINNNNWYGSNGTHPDITTNAVDETSLRANYFQKSFRSMIIDQPLKSWIYCLDFWLQASNLLSDLFLDIDSFGLYYIMFLHDKVPANKSSIYKSLHTSPGGIKDYVSKGIKDFNMSLNNNLSDISDNCYAVVHLLEATVEPGGIGNVIDREFARQRIDYLSKVFTDNTDIQTAFYGWFSDSNKAYNALMEGDSGFNKVMQRLI
jgi:hypothetical protein